MRKESSQIINFFDKTNCYINWQLIVHGKVDHNILVMKTEIACNQYV